MASSDTMSDASQTGARYLKLIFLGLLALAAGDTGRAERSVLQPEGRQPETVVPRKGVILVADPAITDPIFQRTVILLLVHGAEGTLGLIINRPTTVQLSDVAPELGLRNEQSPSLYFGGPVGLDALLFLVRSSEPPEKATHVVDDIYFSGERKLLEQLLEGNKGAERLRLYAGHAGWAAGQLASEIARGDWQLVRGNTETVLKKNPDTLWRDLTKRRPRPRNVVQAAPRAVCLSDAKPGVGHPSFPGSARYRGADREARLERNAALGNAKQGGKMAATSSGVNRR